MWLLVRCNDYGNYVSSINNSCNIIGIWYYFTHWLILISLIPISSYISNFHIFFAVDIILWYVYIICCVLYCTLWTVYCHIISYRTSFQVKRFSSSYCIWHFETYWTDVCHKLLGMPSLFNFCGRTFEPVSFESLPPKVPQGLGKGQVTTSQGINQLDVWGRTTV